MSFIQSPPNLHDASSQRDGNPIASKFSLGRGGLFLSPLIKLVRDPAWSVGGLIDGLRYGAWPEERAELQKLATRRQVLYARLDRSWLQAVNYDAWQTAADELDLIEDNESWKMERQSSEYDVELVEARLKQLDDARISCNVDRMLFLVRTSLSRGLGDMGNIRLYKHSHTGTKELIERYIDSALKTLNALIVLSSKPGARGPDPRYILDQVLLARQSFGRSALLLSGGATFGMNHVGVLKALWEANLLPRIISGASAGSIVCAVLCTKTDEEIPILIENFPFGNLAVFEKEGEEDTLLKRLARFLKIGAWIDIQHLMDVMKEMLGDITFQEAYNRTRRILNICVSSASVYELPRLLNYVTAPNVLIRSAVAASCSVPLVFSAASLLAKDLKTGGIVAWDPSPQRWIDGSVDNDLPMTRLAEMFNVNHFIVSQVNPHVVPFLAKEKELISAEGEDSNGKSWVSSLTSIARTEALHRLHVLAEIGILPNAVTKARSVLSQKYSGDITIFPEISLADFPRMLKNPTTEFMLQATLCGEKATWPKMSRIQNHCAIELALDDAVQKLRGRVVFSPSQVDLRQTNIEILKTKNKPGRKPSYRRRRRSSQCSEPNEVSPYKSKLELDQQSFPQSITSTQKPKPPNTPHHSPHSSLPISANSSKPRAARPKMHTSLPLDSPSDSETSSASASSSSSTPDPLIHHLSRVFSHSTPSTPTSTPRRSYFPPLKVDSQPKASLHRTRNSEPAISAVAPLTAAEGGECDLSGTRAMLRRKKSSSAALSSLWVPWCGGVA
ncbi:MAG: hypothetical protein M1829_004062 [Trizodia sp. TS-e1964]|nr:MAG: hypothetical protein M1829_004062 [Trizodia sp. TS-e1964]